MITTIALHSDKGDMSYQGEKLGLEGKALNNFSYALYEVLFEVYIDEKTGDYTILKVTEGNQVLIPLLLTVPSSSIEGSLESSMKFVAGVDKWEDEGGASD